MYTTSCDQEPRKTGRMQKDIRTSSASNATTIKGKTGSNRSHPNKFTDLMGRHYTAGIAEVYCRDISLPAQAFRPGGTIAELAGGRGADAQDN